MLAPRPSIGSNVRKGAMPLAAHTRVAVRISSAICTSHSHGRVAASAVSDSSTTHGNVQGIDRLDVRVSGVTTHGTFHTWISAGKRSLADGARLGGQRISASSSGEFGR
jgi:hypothetical protein